MIETPTFGTAAVVAPHMAAADAGRAILLEGGNAIEAMIAMAACIAVVYPHMNSVGGDAFWLIREPKGRVRYIEACGYAGEKATWRAYRDRGDRIPSRGPLAALTVPGAVGGWALAYDYSKAGGGRLSVRDLLAAAVKQAREGVAVSPCEARDAINEREALYAAPGFAEAFLHEGKIPPAGHMRKMERLAATLEQLGDAGLMDFYRGDVGREIAADLERIGSPVTRRDMEKYQAVMRGPLELKLPGRTHYNAPPPTQGLAALIALGVYDRLGVTRIETFEHIHGLVESIKRAFRVRDQVVTDFGQLKHDTDEFLSAAFLEKQAHEILRDRAAPWPAPPAKGDTVWMGAVDDSGIAVSYIQSIYWEYGSGCVLPTTGVLMQNRGVSFSIDEKALNQLNPGRRPFHTLNPAMAVFDDGRLMPYGSMGGDGQPQFQAQVFTRYLGGMGLQDAVDAPRFLLGRTWGETSTSLKLEDRFDPSLVRALERAGHEVAVLREPYSDVAGHAGAIVRHARGRVEAAHDPRSDGGASGF
jgi:gamma-glutamyltranspeptidase